MENKPRNQKHEKICFSDFDDYDDEAFSSVSPSGHTQYYSTNETFEEMIRRKTDENLRKLFGRDG